MSEQLNQQQQRWLAIGLLVFVCLLVVMLLIVPIISKGLEYYENKQDLAFRLKRFNQVVSSKDAVLAKISEAREQFQAQGYFSTQKTESLASAELQKFLKKAIATAEGQLTSTQVLPRKDERAFTRIAVKVRMTGDMEVLRSVLYEIETSKPLILVEQLDIRPSRGKRNRKTRKVEVTGKLNINFQVASFMKEKL
jgi:general secretion pathway protein M